MKHDLQVFTKLNFSSQVEKYRQSYVFVIYGFTKSENAKTFIQGEFNSLAEEIHGMVKVGVVDCDEWSDFCKQPIAKNQKNVIFIYPPMPFSPYLYEGDLKKDALMKLVLPLIPSGNVKILTSENSESFLSENISLPKVLLFSNKNKSPPLFNALSNTFQKKLSMGYIDSNSPSSSALISRYNVKTFPQLLVLVSDKKQKVYNGEMKFRNLFDWLNVFSETFVMGGGFSDRQDPHSSQPWLSQKIPEMTKASHQDICFAKDKGLCVIYLKNGGPITSEEINLLDNLANEFVSHVSDRGINFLWMWMDLSVEKQFAEMLEVVEFPSVAVFNPHKKLRYVVLPPDTIATKETIESLLNKIAGGDARFKIVPGKKLPAFTVREEPKKDKKQDEL